MTFQNPILAGTSLVRQAIKSPNYVPGSAGWSINQDGTSEFSSTTVRGNVVAGSLSAGSIGSSSIVNSAMMGGSISETAITFDSGGGSLLVYTTTTVTTTYNGSGTFSVPVGVTSATLKCWGGGGGAAGGGLAGGANSGGYGGGGGAYSEVTATVTPGDTLTITVGNGGVGGAANNLGSNGGDSKVVDGSGTTLVRAKAGLATTVNSPAAGGSASGGIGSILFSGGNGGSATGSGGSGGGGAAGNSGSGGAGASTSSSTGGAGGTANDGGGNGGAGANSNAIGSNGTTPGGGGGGGGGGSSAGSGGTGGGGRVIIVYTATAQLIGSIAPTAGTDSMGNSYPEGFSVDNLLARVSGATETWHPVTFVNSWSNGVNTSTPLQYRKLASPAGAVQVIGSCHSPNPFVGTTIFNLPVGYRPSHDQYVTICRDVATFDRVKFGALGDVSVSSTTPGVDWFFNCIIQTDI